MEGKGNVSKGLRNMKVYIVDDSRLMLNRLKAMLTTLPGVEVVGHAQDPITGLRFIGETKPDAVILEAKSSRSRGIDLLGNIKRHHPSSVVLMLTNGKVSGQRAKGGAHADFTLDKFTELNKVAAVFKQLTRSNLRAYAV